MRGEACCFVIVYLIYTSLFGFLNIHFYEVSGESLRKTDDLQTY